MFEYKYVWGDGYEVVEETLNPFGAEGWHIVSFLWGDGYWSAILERLLR